jgi:hypothetical protein
MTQSTTGQTKPISAYAVVGVVGGGLGVLSLVVPSLLTIGIIAAIVGLLASLDGLNKARTQGHAGRTVAIVGICLSAVTLLVVAANVATHLG